MITVTRYPDGSVRLDAVLDRISVMAPTLGEAYRDITAALDAKHRAWAAHRYLVSVSTVAFDPRRHIYAAECPTAGVKATGFTRQDAWFRLLHGLELRAEELAAEAAGQALAQELAAEAALKEKLADVEEDQVHSGPGGLGDGSDPGDPELPGGQSDPEV